ncbi:hypothetical protein [Leptolyngbya sp. GGD]|uniref:hypothetical protein n=1 Tax=Leptolyngbya sp. GGD TaxID=2997907 RepID=UPI00227CB533|nr:hypothetical protein [Leptolyngbya sp. GGD]MCY6494583.1 hypothetical protein [Leptolyngbya sp. GGD]
MKTAIVRYLLPHPGFKLNFDVVAGQPLRRQQAARGLELASTINIEELSDLDRVLSWQEKVFITLDVKPNVRGVYKSHLKHFLTWCQEQGFLRPQREEEWAIPVCYPGAKRTQSYGDKTAYPITNRHLLVPYRLKLEQLSECMQQQFREFESFWVDPHYSGYRPIPGAVEEMTYELCFRFILQLLGWLVLDKVDYYHQMRQHAHSKQERNPRYESDWLLVDSRPPVWIEELNKKYPPKNPDQIILEDLIPIIDIRSSNLDAWIVDDTLQQNSPDVSNQELLDEIQAELSAKNVSLSFGLVAKLGQALQQSHRLEEIRALRNLVQREEARERSKLAAQGAAQSVRSFLNNYIRWLKYQHNPLHKADGYRISSNYILKFYHGSMNWAKFLYRNITDSTMYPDYRDIAVIMELRKMRSEEENAPSRPNNISPVKRNPAWQELGRLLKKLLELCSPRLKVDEKWNINSGRLRLQRAVAKDFQRYLIVMFFRTIAPDRQHVVRELRVHDTLRLYHLNSEVEQHEEAPWDSKSKRYKVYYNTYTKLYYLDPADAKDETGNVPHRPIGKPFEWVVDLDATQTKTDRESSYRIPKIYNPELQAWLYGREDYSETWHNWPSRSGTKQKNRYRLEQFNWCGFVVPETKQLSGFRDIFQPNHDYVFTQKNGNPFSGKSLRGLYENIIWSHLGIRANPHGVRSSATDYFERQGMTDAESKSLAILKNHSPEMQDSSAYNKLKALEKTALASQMITEDFLREFGLNPDKYGLHNLDNGMTK